MRKKISVKDLRIGMFVDGLEKSWFKTPFLTHRFLIKNEQQIKKIIDAGISYVYIDTEKCLNYINEDEAGIITGTDKFDILDNSDDSLTQAEFSQEEIKNYIQQKDEFIPIDKTTLVKGSFIDFSLFIKRGLVISPFVEFDKRDILIDENILNTEDEFLISQKDIQKYKSYLKELVKNAIQAQHNRLRIMY